MRCNIVCKMVKESYDAISISCDLPIMKVYSTMATFMLHVDLLFTKEHTFS